MWVLRRDAAARAIGLAAIVLVVVLLPAVGWTSVRVAWPSTWKTGDQADAQRLITAKAWAGASEFRTVEVATSPELGEDSLPLAMVAILETDTPLPGAATQSEGHAGAWLEKRIGPMDPQLLSVPDFVEVVETQGPPTIHAGWSSDAMDFEVFVAPSGATTSALVMAYAASDRERYEPVFDDLLSSMSGVVAPTVPFRHSTWRLGGLAGALLLGVGLHLGFLALGDQRSDHRGASSRAAAAMIAIAAVAGVVAYSMLRGDPRLASHGVTALSVSAELVAAIVAVAAALFAMGRVLRPEQRVQSAPPPTDSHEGPTMHPKAGPGVPVAVDSDAALEDIYRTRD